MPAFTIYIHAIDIELGEESNVSKFIEALCDDIHAAGILVKGTSLFFDMMPESGASPCMALYDLGGNPSVTSAPEMLVQFRVRGSTYEEARDKAAEVFNFYHTESDREIGGYRVVYAQAEGMPAKYDNDSQGRHIYGFNMVFKAHSLIQSTSTVGYGGSRDPNENV